VGKEIAVADERAREVAAEIRRQIPRSTLMAVGAREFLYYGPEGSFSGKGLGGLTFKTGGGAHIGRFNITLNGMDTYDIEYLEGGTRAPYRPKVWRASGIYNEALGRIVRELQEHRAAGIAEGTLGAEWGAARTRSGRLLGRTGDRVARRRGVR